MGHGPIGMKTCLGGGFSLLGPNKLTLGPVDLFGPKKRRCSSTWDFGEIDFANDRLKLKSTLILLLGTSECPFNNKTHTFVNCFGTISRNPKTHEQCSPEGRPKPPGIGVILVWAP